MKKIILSLSTFCVMVIACSNPSGVECVTDSFSSKYFMMDMGVELPNGSDLTSVSIRGKLLTVASEELIHSSIFETTADIATSPKELKSLFHTISLDNKNAPLNGLDFEVEGAEKYLEDFEPWYSSLRIERVADTKNYCVYHSFRSFYYGEGAYPHFDGVGYLTFDKKDGSLFTEFLKDGVENDMQPILSDGLKGYFDGAPDFMDCLFLHGGRIALPEQCPYPSKDGIVFEYKEEEIGPHVIGAPTFTVPYDDMMPFLSKKAQKMLNL